MRLVALRSHWFVVLFTFAEYGHCDCFVSSDTGLSLNCFFFFNQTLVVNIHISDGRIRDA